jgi:hypothetical protein
MKHFAGLFAVAVICWAQPISIVAGAELAGPVTWGSPDQPWGTRRSVTAADHAIIAGYRSGDAVPIYQTKFNDAAALEKDWRMISDDNPDLKSCRRPASVEASSAGLRLKTLLATDCKTAKWSTGFVGSKATYGYGFFDATMKIADIKGVNNAFWLTTDDGFEIDIAEATYPSYMHLGLQYWPRTKLEKHMGMGWGVNLVDNLAYAFHDIGLLWTPTYLVYEIDGEPVAAARTHNAIKGKASVLLSTALGDWAGGPVRGHPEGHNMVVQSVHIYAPSKP